MYYSGINLAINQGCKTIIKNKNNNVDIDNREGQEFADYMIQRIRTMMI